MLQRSTRFRSPERILASPRYRDGRFHNTEQLDSPIRKGTSTLSTMPEFLFGGAARRPSGLLPVESPRDTWLRPIDSGLRVTWLGHSTVLIEIDGRRVLTDPVWSERISPFPLVGPRRFHAMPVSVDELPPLDAVLVSHDHYDHLDAPTVRDLARLDVPFVTSLGVGARLEALGIAPERIVELDWWEETTLPKSGLAFTATPSRHFSGRSPFDRNRTLWSSWILTGEKHRVFFSGDTGLTTDLATIGERKGPFDLVMLEVGAFHEAWGDTHLGPDNALIAHRMLGGGTLLPVHWGTFDLALHAWDEPAETLVSRADALGIHVITPRLGRAVEPVQLERVDPWWREVAPATVEGSPVAPARSA
ncbi:MBL fold metallo-hydrolase [bacterium]|nr:MAG: MBL fold metallo-hydrolase [bacterium]